MTRPKEEDSEEWLGATAAQYRQPAAVGGVAGSAVADYEWDEDNEEECFQAWTSPQRPRQRPPQRPPPDDRHHLVRRKTAPERPSEGNAAPDSCPSPRSVRSGWRPGPRQGPLPPGWPSGWVTGR
ncbi:unnamed protein product [Gadus morhua 'NCC']